MPREFPATPPPEFALRSLSRFFREHGLAAIVLSALLLVPCFWHSRIQAGDLGSHVYNAWLAQLIERQQIPGLVLAHQWNNMLFDVLLGAVGNLFGLVSAEKIVVSLAVLVFFWGSFSFLSELAGRQAWLLTPLLAVFSYGYVFHMGFMNYYFSIGLAFFALALTWRGGAGNWMLAAAVAGLCFAAHPIGFLLVPAISAYMLLQRSLPLKFRPVVPSAAIVGLILAKYYFAEHQALNADWRAEGLAQLFGQDQLNVFGHRYATLAWWVLAWAIICALAAGYDWAFRRKKPVGVFALAVELYAVAVIATVCLPENFRVSLYAGWIGLLVSRLTLVTAVFGLLALSSLQLPRWTVYGNSFLALIFMVFLYQDTGKLDRLEASARATVQTLAPGTRIVAVANPPQDWRIQFIYHSIERACVGRCFSFANYEPSSLQFRVRASAGNYFVSTSVDQADDMASGDYIVRKEDLPLTSIYQCDEGDFTQVCALALRAGQKTEDPEAEPGPIPTDPEQELEN